MLKVIYRTLHPDRGDLSDEDNGQWEYESSRKIGINRPQIRAKPFIFRDENEPVEDQAEEIPNKYDDHKTSEEPEVPFCDLFISDKTYRVC